MRGLSIDFTKEGAELLPAESVEDKAAVAQSLLVEVVTTAGSRLVLPESGTALARFVQGGGTATWSASEHAGNYAALNAMTAANQWLEGDLAISALKVGLALLLGQEARYSVGIVFADGTTIGDLTGRF